MRVASEIRAEIERELIEYESSLLLRKLQARIHEVTFGELRELLASPAGRLLLARPVEELMSAREPAPPRARPRRATQADTAGELLKVLYASVCPLTPRALVEATGRDSTQVQRALRLLRERGQILMVDRPPRPSYWAQEGGDYAGVTTESRHAAEVVAALRASGRSLSLRELASASGLSEERVRRAVTFLINSRQVTRSGRSVSTRYAVAAPPREAAEIEPRGSAPEAVSVPPVAPARTRRRAE